MPVFGRDARPRRLAEQRGSGARLAQGGRERQDPEAHGTRRVGLCAEADHWEIVGNASAGEDRGLAPEPRESTGMAADTDWPGSARCRKTASDVASPLLTVAGRWFDLHGEHLLCLDGFRLTERLQPAPHLIGRERPRLALCRDSLDTGLGEEWSVRAGLFPVGHGQQGHEGQTFRASAIMSPLDTGRTQLRDVWGIVALEGPSVDGDAGPAVNAFTPDDQDFTTDRVFVLRSEEGELVKRAWRARCAPCCGCRLSR